MIYHIWLTIPLPVDEGKLIGGLVIKGYNVSAASATGEIILTEQNACYGILSFKIEHQTSSSKELYDDLCNILMSSKYTYYSLIISDFSVNCLWNSGNVISDFSPLINKASRTFN